MVNEVRDFFDSLAERWDEMGQDPLPRVRSLLDRVDFHPGSRILDLACGTGVISGMLHDEYGGAVLGLDISPKMIEVARRKYEGKEGVAFEVEDFLSPSFKGDFDYIVCYNAFPHFVDVDRFVEQIHDRLIDGGEFVIFHTLGRERLKEHHSGIGPNISRDLEPVEDEANKFARLLTVLACDEGEDHIFIHGRK